LSDILKKTSAEKLDCTIDFSNNLAAGDEISSVTVTAIDKKDGSSASIIAGGGDAPFVVAGTQTVQWRYTGGTSGHMYVVTVQATIDDGQILEEIKCLGVRDGEC